MEIPMLRPRALAAPSPAGTLRATALALLLVAAKSASADPLVPHDPPPDPITLDVGGRVGVALRIGDSPSFPIATRNGGMLGVGASIAPTRRFAIGVAYEHAGMGTESGAGTYGTASVTRSLDTLWATLRLALYFDDRASFGVLLGPGLAWQTAHLDGAVIQASRPPAPLTCTETAYGPDIGVRVGLGTEIKLGRRWAIALDLVFDELHLSSDPLGTCIPGAGSTSIFGARAGLSYRFDVSRALR
jgi:hypothetical protein